MLVLEGAPFIGWNSIITKIMEIEACHENKKLQL